MARLVRGSSFGTCLVTAPASSRTPSRAGVALELRRPLGQPFDERNHFLHPLSQLRLGLLRALGEGGLERVLQIRDGDPEHLEQTASAVLSHGSLLLLKVFWAELMDYLCALDRKDARPLSVVHQFYAAPRSLAVLLTSRGATHRMAP